MQQIPTAIKSSEFIFGIHAIEEALAAGRSLDKVLIADGPASPALMRLRKQLREVGIQLQQVPMAKIEALARGRNHQGILAYLSAIAYQSLDELLSRTFKAKQVPLLVMLDGVTDVRNLGAIARTAEGLGAHGLIVPAEGSARLGADAVQASAGALMHLPVCRLATLKLAVATLQSHGMNIIGCTEKATDPLTSIEGTQPLCIVLGDEGKGISTTVLKLCTRLVKIPMQGQVGSLNVSVAAALALYEVVRQRNHIPS